MIQMKIVIFILSKDISIQKGILGSISKSQVQTLTRMKEEEKKENKKIVKFLDKPAENSNLGLHSVQFCSVKPHHFLKICQ